MAPVISKGLSARVYTSFFSNASVKKCLVFFQIPSSHEHGRLSERMRKMDAEKDEFARRNLMKCKIIRGKRKPFIFSILEGLLPSLGL